MRVNIKSGVVIATAGDLKIKYVIGAVGSRMGEGETEISRRESPEKYFSPCA